MSRVTTIAGKTRLDLACGGTTISTHCVSVITWQNELHTVSAYLLASLVDNLEPFITFGTLSTGLANTAV